MDGWSLILGFRVSMYGLSSTQEQVQSREEQNGGRWETIRRTLWGHGERRDDGMNTTWNTALQSR